MRFVNVKKINKIFGITCGYVKFQIHTADVFPDRSLADLTNLTKIFAGGNLCKYLLVVLTIFNPHLGSDRKIWT